MSVGRDVVRLASSVGARQSSARRGCEDVEPCRPIPAQLEEVLEVGETQLFEIRAEGTQRVLVENRSDRDEVALDAELVLGEAQPLIDRGADECAPLIRLATDENRGRTCGDGYRHAWAEE